MNDDIELLAPAGDLEKLKTAVDYGADAVYFGGKHFGLRSGAGNLSLEEMKEGIAYAHERGRKCYLTFNIFPHNDDIEPMQEYLESIRKIGIDAFLVSDPGTVDIVKEIMPEAVIHLSTQANMTNYRTAEFWKRQGVSRLVLARELSLAEIGEINEKVPDMELEAFVHGAMCISYSGRCLLSNFMTGRDANRGQCAHPCRWKYSIVEEQRPGEYYPIEEDSRGTYVMNSKDLCMIAHIPDLVRAGIKSFKIEGRMKSVFYAASVVGAYRSAIDAYIADPDGWKVDPEWMKSLTRASHREFTTGFFYGKADGDDQNYISSDYVRDCTFTGVVREYDPSSGTALVEQRNKMVCGDRIEVFGPGDSGFSQILKKMTDEEGVSLSSAPHPKQMLRIPFEHPAGENYFVCIRNGAGK